MKQFNKKALLVLLNPEGQENLIKTFRNVYDEVKVVNWKPEFDKTKSSDDVYNLIMDKQYKYEPNIVFLHIQRPNVLRPEYIKKMLEHADVVVNWLPIPDYSERFNWHIELAKQVGDARFVMALGTDKVSSSIAIPDNVIYLRRTKAGIQDLVTVTEQVNMPQPEPDDEFMPKFADDDEEYDEDDEEEYEVEDDEEEDD